MMRVVPVHPKANTLLIHVKHTKSKSMSIDIILTNTRCVGRDGEACDMHATENVEILIHFGVIDTTFDHVLCGSKLSNTLLVGSFLSDHLSPD